MKRKEVNNLKKWALPITGLIALMGCHLPPDKVDAIKQMESTLQQGSDQNLAMQRGLTTKIPSDVRNALRPNMKHMVGNQMPSLQRRFDLVADQIPARTFFLSLVEGTPYNIAVSPGVEGKISLQMKKVTVQEVLDTVRSVYGYEYKRTAQGVEVLPATMQTRAFAINYLDLVREGESETQVTAGTLTSANNSNGNPTGGTTSTTNLSSNTSTLSNGQGQATPPNSIITTTTKADFWKELQKAVEAIVGAGGGRKVAISPVASLIVVHAMPDELKRVDEFLTKAELSLNRQVILDAKILEVDLQDSFQAGINWSLVFGKLNATQLGGETIGQLPTPPPGNPFPILSNSLEQAITGLPVPIDISPGQSAPFNPATNIHAFGGVFALSTSFKHLGTFIELLGAQGRVTVLSSPRISTINNQKALINPMVESIKNERGKTIIIVDKASLNEPVDNSASGVFPISLVPQKYYQKIGETKYFVLYK